MSDKSKRGFASMDPELQKKIASMGGKAVSGSKRSFSQNRALASAAGRKGGSSVDPKNRSFTTNRALAVEAGRKGGSSIDPAKRSFSQNPELAAAAGRKGGRATQKRFAETAGAESPAPTTTPTPEVPET